MTREQILERFPHASADFIRANASDVRATPPPPRDPPPATIVERRQPTKPLETNIAQARDPARYVVRVTGYCIQLLDEDNLCEKFHVDSLRYAGLIPSDAPGRCRIVTTQKKVSKRADERTEILIERLP